MVLGLRHPRAARCPASGSARRHLERQVADPALRELLRPAYRLGCKRILISNRYYPALTRPNVTLVPARGTASPARRTCAPPTASSDPRT